MYSDRLEQAAKQSVKDRLNGNASLVQNSVHRPPVAGKRPRQDDKWEHDLYEDDEPELSRSKAPRLDATDLRLKLQKKSNGGIGDLREKLSGSMHTQAFNCDPARPKAKLEISKPTRKSVIGKAPLVVSRKVPYSIAKKISQQKRTRVTKQIFKHFLLSRKNLVD